MKRWQRLAGTILVLWLGSGVLAQDPLPTPRELVTDRQEAPVRPVPETIHVVPQPAEPCGTCNPACNLNWLYVRYGVKNSFDIYGRFGPAFITSGGDLDDVLHTGLAADFGVRTFLYKPDRSSGCYGELGVDYIFNNANSSIPLIEQGVNVEIVQNVGTFFQTTDVVPARDICGITELHRVYAKIGLGYQRYWWTDAPEGLHYYLDFNAGIRLGHAHASLALLERIYFQDPDIEEGDVIVTKPTLRATDFIKNFYIGGGIGLMIPYCGYDVMAGLHWEYSHDIIRLPMISNRDDGLDQVKVQILAGVRW
ncbi:MAG: hypothetical protein NZM31_08020 [Gemmatales bacterium]|nr:hypothetical protein [Gemmatales bacterium]MDW8386939.1 hypothetical protein [Gemmatales bacterium]